MKKFIVAAFSYVIFGCGGVCASEVSYNAGVPLDALAQKQLDYSKTIAEKIKEQTGVFNDTAYRICNELIEKSGNDSIDSKVLDEKVNELAHMSANIVEQVFSFDRAVSTSVQMNFVSFIGDALVQVYDLQENPQPLIGSNLERLKALKEKTDQLKVFADTLKDKICILPTKLTPEEAQKAEKLYQDISCLTDEEMEECIRGSRDLIIRFFGSPERFEEILLGTGKSITQNERDCWNRLFFGHMSKSMPYSSVLSVVGYPVFKMKIRSLISHLLRAYDKSRRKDAYYEEIIAKANQLNEIYCGYQNRFVFRPSAATSTTVPTSVPTVATETASGVSSSSSSSSQATAETLQVHAVESSSSSSSSSEDPVAVAQIQAEEQALREAEERALREAEEQAKVEAKEHLAN